MSLKNILFGESSDERVELVNKKITSQAFYILFFSLILTNIIKSYYFELEKRYWLDTHILVVGIALYVGCRAILEGAFGKNLPKIDQKRQEKTVALGVVLGVLYSQFTNGSITYSDGLTDLISIMLASILVGVVIFIIVSGISKIKRKNKVS